jgi:transcriptional regulator with XRE-family HTH domain
MAAMDGPVTRFWPLRWGRRPRNGVPAGADPAASGSTADPLQLAGSRLRQAREQRGLSLRELALETRISTPVLEALERGWPDRLPEPAYLRTMLPLLERHLALERGCLRGALPATDATATRGRPSRERWAPLSIELFTTWQGTAAYGVLMLALLYGLNLEQRRLAAQGLHALRPVAPLPAEQQRRLPVRGTSLLLEAYPELQPLAMASRGQGLALLRRQQQTAAVALLAAEPGVLRLNLAQPTRLLLVAEGGLRSQLEGAQGDLVLPLQPPFSLELEPPPLAPTAVQWNGAALAAQQPGRYRWPAAPPGPRP